MTLPPHNRPAIGPDRHGARSGSTDGGSKPPEVAAELSRRDIGADDRITITIETDQELNSRTAGAG
jgi:hypothetical protein